MVSVFRQARQRKGARADLLVVGLGNPGDRFQSTRHNVGAEAVKAYIAKHGTELKLDRRRKAHSCELNLAGCRVVVACPTTFMNESGMAVRALIKRYGIQEAIGLVIVHDELDLNPGRVKLKLGGGTAGHNGLRSIQSHIKSLDFLRLRIGIGKPADLTPGAVWVLRKPQPGDRSALDQAIERTSATLDTLVASGVEAAMNVANSP